MTHYAIRDPPREISRPRALVRGKKRAGNLLEELFVRRDARRDHRHSRFERFERDERHPLTQARREEELRPGEPVTRRPSSREGDAIVEARGADARAEIVSQ